jgi:hypothetical protein
MHGTHHAFMPELAELRRQELGLRQRRLKYTARQPLWRWFA